MSIYLATINDYLSRNSGLLPVTAAHTVMVWVRNRTNVATTDNTAYAGVDARPFTTDQCGLFTATDQDSKFRADRSGGFFAENTSTIGNVTNQWFHICYTANGNTSNNTRFYVNGQYPGGVPNSFNFTSFVKTLELLGSNGFDTVADHDFVYFRAWTDDLTQNEIIAEMQSSTPVRTANLWMDTPLETDLLDDSGNGRNWTQNGSGTFTPYNPFPDNSGYSSAVEIATLPYDISGVSADLNGIVFDLWYKWTATFTGAIGILPSGSTGYEPFINIFTLVAGVLTAYPQPSPINGYGNFPVQVGVELGTTYYIKVNANGGTTIPSTLTLNVQAFTDKAVPVGSLLIIDDTDNYPTTIVSAINGDNNNVLRFIQPGLAFSEGGDILPDRILFVADNDDTELKLYDNSLALLNTISYTKSTGGQLTYVKANRITNVFWVGDKNPTNPNKFSKYDSEGALVTTFTITQTNLRAFAPNSDDTILYIGNFSNVVKQWNIGGAAFGADLVAAISGYQIEDLLLLSDGTLLVFYTKLIGPPYDSFVKRYDSTGTLLNTYVVEPSGTWVRVSNVYYLSSAVDEPNSFWACSHRYATDNLLTYAVFRNIKISDGTVLSTVEHVEYVQGIYRSIDVLPPIARYGPSPSCPIIVLRESLTPPEGTATLTVIKVTDPSPDITNTDFTVNVGGGLSPAQLIMQDGDSHVYTEVPAGIYSVAEIVPAGWAVTYDVSNGDSPAEIEIADGDNVTVTITNTRGTGGGGGGEADNILSGIYKIVPGKRNDTLWRSFDPRLEKEVKIPDPFIKTGLIGG